MTIISNDLMDMVTLNSATTVDREIFAGINVRLFNVRLV